MYVYSAIPVRGFGDRVTHSAIPFLGNRALCSLLVLFSAILHRVLSKPDDISLILLLLIQRLCYSGLRSLFCAARSECL